MVHHNPQQNRFEYVAPDGALAVCEYTRKADVWDLNHTYVPDSLRGQGIAAKLVDAAVAHIRRQGGMVRPSCSYVAVYFERHPELHTLLAKAV